MFLAEGEEVLSARDGQDVAAILAGLSRERAEAIGRRARERVLREHTYASRAEAVDRLFAEMLRPNRVEAAE
jgi:spore maturation protein CgeB